MASNVTIGGGQASLNFTGSQVDVPASGTATFNTYFVNTASSVLYAGYGTIASPSASPNASLIITANTVTTVPGGYAAVLDTASGDTLTGGGAGTTYFLQNNGPNLGTVLTLTSGSTAVYALGADTVYAGAAAATVAAGGQGTTVLGGDSSLLFIGGVGAASVLAGAGTSTIYGGTGDNVLIGGAGASTIVGGAGAGASTLVAGAGTTTAFAVGAGNTTLIGGSGNSELVGVTGTGNELLATDPNGVGGSVHMDLNNASDTVLGGGGASTVFGGAGYDVYAFINGHAGGTTDIYGFKPTDIMAFAGYGANPIALEHVVQGADVLVLTDGTVITIEGYDHTIFK
jgi:Ca2+-binding RTX toxin-like protein